MLNLTERIEAIVYARAAEVGAGYRMPGYYDQENEQFHARGNWDADYNRVGHGVTKAMVDQLRSELKAQGVRISFEEADALLLEAQTHSSAYHPAQGAKNERKRKDLRRREERRSQGFCIICGREPAMTKADSSQASACKTCSERATEYNKRKRARAKK